ncbi:hypothetical protein FOMPIDRAFT_1111746 [Fomitopsis schrenkii]|uniref:Uncharacterized protein n=1 Tax=Fomitopsis schrenkii TaxID=2126942 RepID=S8FVX1_FOMSC|nr:hypothetical protein FOMPIDRAFT_1111746 [Fomitopsis schrenkii]
MPSEHPRRPLAHIPTPSTLTSNPFIAPQDGRCLINDLLPPELLAQMFMAGMELDDDPVDEDDDTDEDNMDEDEDSDDDSEGEEREKPPFEVTVSHVCKLWRDVAISTPALWSTLEFSRGPPSPESAVYLERSKGAPLDIAIDITNDDCEDYVDDFEDDDPSGAKGLEQILDLIIPHVWHWRSLELMVSDYLPMHSALTRMGACAGAPLLEVLQLYHYEDSEDGAEAFAPAKHKQQDFVLFHGHAPRLTHVALWGVHLDWARSTFLRGLAELELAYHAKDVWPPYRDFARILRDSPAIETLTLCSSGPAGGPVEWLGSVLGADAMQAAEGAAPEASTVLTVPSLENLVIAFLDPEYTKQLIERLALPKLVSLALDFEEADGTTLLQALIRPSQVTGKSVLSGLRALKIMGVQCDDDATIAEFYAASVNLYALNLNFGFVSMRWHEVLLAQWESVANSNRDPLLPKLDHLTTTSLPGNLMRNLIEARKATGKPLKRVYMNQDDELAKEDEDWIMENVEEFEYFEGSDEEDDIEDIIIEMPEDGEDGDEQEGDEWEDVD